MVPSFRGRGLLFVCLGCLCCNLTLLNLRAFNNTLGQLPAATTDEKRTDKRVPEEVDWKILKEDRRLAFRVSLSAEKPTVRQVLTRLHVATRVPLRAEPEPLANQYSFGALQAHNAPTWQVLRQVLLVRGVQGHWEKDGDGYCLRLRPEEVVEQAQPWIPTRMLWWGLSVNSFLVLLAAVYCLWLTLNRDPEESAPPSVATKR